MPNHKVGIEKIRHFIEIENKDKGCKLLTKEYINCTHKLKLQCKCGKIFEALWQHIKKGKLQCNTCGLKRRPRKIKTTYDEIKNEIESSSECILLTSKEEFDNEVFKNRKSPTNVILTLRCSQCKKETFKITLRRWRERRKDNCYSCSIKNRSWSYEKVKHYVEVESGSGCKLLSTEYNGVLEPLTFQCFCGNIFKKPFNQFKDYGAQHCGKHRASVGEKIIMYYCDKYKIKYKHQYTFDDCRNEKVLPFDIAIFNHFDVLEMLIEYHGEQHYEPKGFGIKDETERMYKFMKQQINDNIKQEYCKNKGIKLLIIPYWEKENIETILDNELKHLKQENNEMLYNVLFEYLEYLQSQEYIE